jgi:hypothetical protein
MGGHCSTSDGSSQSIRALLRNPNRVDLLEVALKAGVPKPLTEGEGIAYSLSKVIVV